MKRGSRLSKKREDRKKYHSSKEEYRIPSKMVGFTTIYKLVEELKRKII